MQILTTVADMVSARDRSERPLGLVPTMGFLHEGHLELVRRAREQDRTVVVSIFVNPTQFGPGEDLASYPRDMERDLSLLQEERVDIVFSPPPEEVYPKGYSTYVDVEGVTGPLEGERRPGHFRGVATVVAKLLTIVRPDRTYFGQKDGQQVAVVKRMSLDLNLGSEIVVVPTVREADGLALSSRNVYLTEDERLAALVLYRTLCRVRDMWQDGVRDVGLLRGEAEAMIGAEPLAQLDYISVADADTLEELERVDGNALALVAARFGKARLIDNVVLGDMDAA
jgi:pantoate--beta-alanine ligase